MFKNFLKGNTAVNSTAEEPKTTATPSSIITPFQQGLPTPQSQRSAPPFFPPQPRFPAWDTDMACMENLYFITKQIGNADPYKDKVTPTVFFDYAVLQELQYIGRRMYNITGESGHYLLYKQLQNRYPHFLIYDYFLVDQVASAGEVEMDGEDSKRYWDYLLATYPEEYGNNIHPYLGHGHWHPDEVPNFSSVDHKQQNTGEGLAFMAPWRIYTVMRRDGSIKAAMVQYFPVFRRIEDCHIGIHFPTGQVIEPLTKERKAVLDTQMDALIKKRNVFQSRGPTGILGGYQHPFTQTAQPGSVEARRSAYENDLWGDYGNLTLNSMQEVRAAQPAASQPAASLTEVDATLGGSLWVKCTDKMSSAERLEYQKAFQEVLNFFVYYFATHLDTLKEKLPILQTPSYQQAVRVAEALLPANQQAAKVFASLEEGAMQVAISGHPEVSGIEVLERLLEVALVYPSYEKNLVDFVQTQHKKGPYAGHTRDTWSREILMARAYLAENFFAEFHKNPVISSLCPHGEEDAAFLLAEFVVLSDFYGDDVVENALSLSKEEIYDALMYGVTYDYTEFDDSEEEDSLEGALEEIRR